MTKLTIAFRNFANATKTLHFVHPVRSCIPYNSHHKQQLFPYTALTSPNRNNVFSVRYTLELSAEFSYIMLINFSL
jgi:hypothetical protein